MSISTSTEASDFVRFHFHLITEYALPAGGCTKCLEDVVFLLSSITTPAEVLAAPHDCTAAWDSAQILAQELTDHPEKW